MKKIVQIGDGLPPVLATNEVVSRVRKWHVGFVMCITNLVQLYLFFFSTATWSKQGKLTIPELVYTWHNSWNGDWLSRLSTPLINPFGWALTNKLLFYFNLFYFIFIQFIYLSAHYNKSPQKFSCLRHLFF